MDHVIRPVDEFTVFLKDDYLESPTGSIFKIVSVGTEIVSASVDDDGQSDAIYVGEKKKRKSTKGRTKVWKVGLLDCFSGVEFSVYQAREKKVKGMSLWGLANHYIVTSAYAMNQIEQRRERAQQKREQPFQCPSNSPPEVLEEIQNLPREEDEEGFLALSQEARIAARTWLKNNYLGDPNILSQEQKFVVDMGAMGQPIHLHVARVILRRYHQYIKDNMPKLLEEAHLRRIRGGGGSWQR